MGLPRVFFAGVLLYRKESKVKETLERFGRGTPNDWLERNLRSIVLLPVFYALLAIELLIFGWPALIMWGVQMIWIPLWAMG